MRKITTRPGLIALMPEIDWRRDEIAAEIRGRVLGVAGSWPDPNSGAEEQLHLVLLDRGDGELACLSLAHLLSWAADSGTVDDALRAWQEYHERGADAANSVTGRTLDLVLADAFRRARGSAPPVTPDGAPDVNVTRCRWHLGRERCVMWRDHLADDPRERHMTRDGTWHRDEEGFLP